jgi:hypothetical protein
MLASGVRAGAIDCDWVWGCNNIKGKRQKIFDFDI